MFNVDGFPSNCRVKYPYKEGTSNPLVMERIVFLCPHSAAQIATRLNAEQLENKPTPMHSTDQKQHLDGARRGNKRSYLDAVRGTQPHSGGGESQLSACQEGVEARYAPAHDFVFDSSPG